jgi:hypothetical protein
MQRLLAANKYTSFVTRRAATLSGPTLPLPLASATTTTTTLLFPQRYSLVLKRNNSSSSSSDKYRQGMAKVAALRKLLNESKIDAYIVPTADAHQVTHSFLPSCLLSYPSPP